MTWRERIQAAREQGGFTEEDYSSAKEWTTCAVGESGQHLTPPQIAALETSWGEDNLLGLEFLQAVQRPDFDACERLLDQIEDRALQLKREMSA